MVLYHASQQKNLKAITPQRTLSLDKYIGDYVFATANKNMALMYLTPKGLPTLMEPNGVHPNIVICASPKQFLERDKGGAIYELPAVNFTKTPQEGLTEYEMVSQKSIKPLNKTIYTSILEALKEAGIQIRFVDQKTFDTLIKSPDQKQLINELSPYQG